MDNSISSGTDCYGQLLRDHGDCNSAEISGTQKQVIEHDNYVNQWVDLTVEKEIFRGFNLREEKTKPHPHPLEPCRIVNKSSCFEAPPCYTRKQASQRSSQEKYCNGTFNTTSWTKKCARRCPLRIAELAVPTKRQCLDTWRNKCDVLPACMVERLRQQVMDERPLVQISDAITYFKRRSPKTFRSKRSRTNNLDTKYKKKRNAEIQKLCALLVGKIAQKLMKPQRLHLCPELDNLAKVIASDITKILRNRKKHEIDNALNRKINDDVSNTIAVWIATIIKHSSLKLLEEDLIELEEKEGPVLDLIDALIYNVSKLCEPEKVDMDKNDVSETASKAEKTTDSTENNKYATSTLYTNNLYDTEDGLIINNDIKPIDSKTQISPDQEVNNPSKDLHINALEGTEPASINDYIQEEIHKIIDSFVGDDNIENESGQVSEENERIQNKLENNITNQNTLLQPENLESEKTSQDQIIPIVAGEDASSNAKLYEEASYNITNQNTLLPPENVESEKTSQDQIIPIVGGEDASSNSELFKEASYNITNQNTLLPPENLESEKTSRDQIIPIVAGEDTSSNSKLYEEAIVYTSNRSDNLENDNENEASELLETNKELSDENDKNVMFSQIDTRAKQRPIKTQENSLQSTESHKIYEKFKVSWNSSTNSIRQYLVLGPINENLLSDADESWPEDIPILKSSASVNKSIQSLGKIMESDDEKSLIFDDETSIILNADYTQNIHETDQNYESFDENNKKEVLQQVKELTELIKVTSEINISNAISQQEYPSEKIYLASPEVDDIQRENITIAKNKMPSPGYTLDTIVQNEPSGLYGNETSQPLHTQEDTISYDLEDEKNSHITKTKFDYKVHPDTAPSWLFYDYAKGEPRSDSPGYKGFKESDISNWCKDLDRQFEILELWSSWIDTTCKNIYYLRKKRANNNLLPRHAKRKYARIWIKLRTNIDKDTRLWSKLYQQIYERQQINKDKIASTKCCTRCNCKTSSEKKGMQKM